jgi:hypothetical protein
MTVYLVTARTESDGTNVVTLTRRENVHNGLLDKRLNREDDSMLFDFPTIAAALREVAYDADNLAINNYHVKVTDERQQ